MLAKPPRAAQQRETAKIVLGGKPTRRAEARPRSGRSAPNARAFRTKKEGVRGGTTGSPTLFEPGREEALDLAAAAGTHEATADELVLDDDERRHRCDAEPFDEVRALLLVDPVELERAVVAPALEDLGEEPVDAPT